MKVIAKATNDTFICEVSNSELEKFMNLYCGKMQKMQVGQEIDLARAYDFARDTRDALKKTSEFIGANAKVIEAILNGVTLAQKVDE